jgi:hypothetical protein
MAIDISGPDMVHRDPESSGEVRTNALVANTRCCFCFPCFGSRRSSDVGLAWWQRVRSSQVREERWWFRGLVALKKLRELSEIVAGPRWKTFIRRFNRSRSGGGSSAGRQGAKFQYDPLSYALNFDEGPGQNGDYDADDDYPLFRNFSSRYVSAPSHLPTKSSSSSSSGLDSGRNVAVVA